MYEEGMSFKTSLGGFNREDVLRYIEQSAKENSERIEALRQEADGLREECGELREKNEALSQKNADLLERLGEMTVTEEKSTQELSVYKDKTAQNDAVLLSLRERISVLEAENGDLKQEKDALAKRCAEFDEAKEKLAEIELSAHRRAKETEERAQFDAKRVRVQSAEVISLLKKELGRVSEEYSVAAAQAKRVSEENDRRAGELRQKLAQVVASLDEVVVGELSASQPDASERLRMQQVLDILRGKEGE